MENKLKKSIILSGLILISGLCIFSYNSFAKTTVNQSNNFYNSTTMTTRDNVNINVTDEFSKDKFNRINHYSTILDTTKLNNELNIDFNNKSDETDLQSNGILLFELGGKNDGNNKIKVTNGFNTATLIQIVNPIINFSNVHPKSKVNYDATLNYSNDNDLIPSSITYKINSDDKDLNIEYTIANVSNDGDVNYKTGEIVKYADESVQN